MNDVTRTPRRQAGHRLALAACCCVVMAAAGPAAASGSSVASSVSSIICTLYPCYRGVYPTQYPAGRRHVALSGHRNRAVSSHVRFPSSLNALDNQHTPTLLSEGRRPPSGSLSRSHHQLPYPPYRGSASLRAPSAGPDTRITHRVTFVINQGARPIGTIVLGLYGFIAPKTVRNFVEIASGRLSKKYEGTIFHRVIKSFMLQGGDVDHKNGLGSWSIYGPQFEDENFVLKHTEPYLLSMANAGKDTNGSQFFITTVPTPWLDGHHVVFGKVLEGASVVKAVEATETDENDAPLTPVYIASSTVEEFVRPFVK